MNDSSMGPFSSICVPPPSTIELRVGEQVIERCFDDPRVFYVAWDAARAIVKMIQIIKGSEPLILSPVRNKIIVIIRIVEFRQILHLDLC